MQDIFVRLAVSPSAVLCPLHRAYDKCFLFWCDERERFVRPFTVLHPYTVHRINAACFGAMRA